MTLYLIMWNKDCAVMGARMQITFTAWAQANIRLKIIKRFCSLRSFSLVIFLGIYHLDLYILLF